MGARMPRSRYDLRRLCGEIRVAHSWPKTRILQFRHIIKRVLKDVAERMVKEAKQSKRAHACTRCDNTFVSPSKEFIGASRVSNSKTRGRRTRIILPVAPRSLYTPNYQ